MRFFLGATIVFVCVGVLAYHVERTPPATAASLQPAMEWVRTRDGWERPAWTAATYNPPRLHPLVVAAGQGLASVLALTFFQRDKSSAA